MAGRSQDDGEEQQGKPMAERKRPEKTSDAATTRSPADKDIFGDAGATVPEKDRPRDTRRPTSSEASGVD
jgi:hypothetical protein